MFRRFEIGDSDRLCIACPGAEHGEWNWLVVVVLDKSIPVLFHLVRNGPLLASTIDEEHFAFLSLIYIIFSAATN